MSSVNNDILSQALFQTGLSTPVKVEPEETNFFFPPAEGTDFLNSHGQDVAGGLSSDSSLPGNSRPQDLFSSAMGSGGTSSSGPSLNGGVMNQNGFSSSGIFSSQGQYLNPSNGANGARVVPIATNEIVSINGGRIVPPISTNGVVSPSTAGMVPLVPISQHNNAGVGSNPVCNDGFLPSVKTEPYNDLDIDLGDLLSIPTPDVELGPNSIPSAHSAPHSQYSVTPQVGFGAPFPGPGGALLEFQSSSAVSKDANSDLPILDDIFNILEDTEDSFLGGGSPGSMSTAFTGVTQQQSSRPFQGANSLRSAFPSSGVNQPYSKNNTGLVQEMQKRQPLFSGRGIFPSAVASKAPYNNRGFNRAGPVPSPGQSPVIKQVSNRDFRRVNWG